MGVSPVLGAGKMPAPQSFEIVTYRQKSIGSVGIAAQYSQCAKLFVSIKRSIEVHPAARRFFDEYKNNLGSAQRDICGMEQG